MQTFLDISAMNRRQTLNRALRNITTGLSILLFLCVLSTCIIGVGVAAKLAWYLLHWGWSSF